MAKIRTRANKIGGMGNTSNWANKLKDVACFVIGNGPFLKKVNINILQNYFTIGINRAFLLIDPTILIWQDFALWLQHKKKIKKLKAIKYCRKGSSTGDKCYFFNMTGKDSRITGNPALLYGRGSSGPLAYQLAYSLGCNPIILVGMDCKYDKKTGNTDFYGKNPMHRPHTIPYCKRGLKWIRKNKYNKTIINCSDNDIFKKKFNLEEVFEKYNIKSWTREDLKRVLLKDS